MKNNTENISTPAMNSCSFRGIFVDMMVLNVQVMPGESTPAVQCNAPVSLSLHSHHL